MRPQVITTAVLSDDANGICVDQTTSGSASLSLNGVLVSGGVAIIAEAQIISIEGSGNSSGVTFTITGTDADKVTVSEDVTGPDNSTTVSTTYFKTVTGISVDGAITGDVEIGPLAADGMVTRSVMTNWRQTPFNLTLAVELQVGTGTFGVQYTVDAPEIHFPDTPYSNSFGVDASWRNAVGLNPGTNSSTGEDNIVTPIRAVRGRVTAGSATGVYKFTFLQGDNP